jgi:hypothetical protein
MSTPASWRTIGREWFCMLTCYSLLIAPFGCQLLNGGLDDGLVGGVGATSDVGLFINEDTNDPLLMAGRNASGDAFFVFGTRDESGNLEEIESILVWTADGEESFIAFESGRPVHVRGANGSYAHISYNEVSPQQLTASVELYDAATGATTSYAVDIDLEQTAAQVAEAVRAATGQDLPTTTLVGGEVVAKDGRQRVRITIFSPLFAVFVLPLVATVGLMTIILGQVLVAVYTLVAATVELVLLVAFSPLFLIAEILSDVVFRVELVPLWMTFDFLPPPPIVIVV